MQKKRVNFPEAVMSRIEREHITMKPKWYFVLGTAAMAAGIIGASVTSVFLVSLIAFSLRTHGPMGAVRYQQLLSGFPWWAAVLAVGGVAAGVWLLKKYDFSYRYNFLYVVLAFVAAVLLTGWLIDATGVDGAWSRRWPMRKFYQQYDGGPQRRYRLAR